MMRELDSRSIHVCGFVSTYFIGISYRLWLIVEHNGHNKILVVLMQPMKFCITRKRYMILTIHERQLSACISHLQKQALVLLALFSCMHSGGRSSMLPLGVSNIIQSHAVYKYESVWAHVSCHW